MGRYRTPFPGLLAGAIEFVLNRAAALDDDAAAVLAPLAGQWLKLELEGLAIDLWVTVVDDRFVIKAEVDEPDAQARTTIAGTPASLLAMTAPALGGSADVRIEGDTGLAQRFQGALKQLDPDFEKGLSEWFGPLVGLQISRMLDELVQQGRQTVRTGEDLFTRWLREESELVPSPDEWRAFRDGVDAAREAVDRLERKIKRRGA
ncbi:MAG: SCP2 sterol-binding domain-containing protein [Wenzhouxiangellaceae bacterium]|nr:SCP2 sterol-binding domain-containing protein [Wenzhouxiangellaceae bacterium]